MAKPFPTIAATSTLAMIRTAQARAVDTTDLLARAGLSLQDLEDPDARIPASTVLALWNVLRERANDSALQLVAPRSLPFGTYRVIDYLVAASTTVGEGVGRFARFFGIIAEAVTVAIDHDDETHFLTLSMADGRPVPAVYVDYVFAALVGRIRMRIKPDLHVHRVELRQNEPAGSDVYARVFEAPVYFGATADRLCFTNEEWNAPIESADAALAQLMEDHARIIAQRIPQSFPGFADDVQKQIVSALAEGGSAEHVARSMCLSVRTLQRKLESSGTTFREVSESVRGKMAEAYLSDRRVSIAEVAFLLGFSDQSSFNRAFRRWTGETPARWRRRHA